MSKMETKRIFLESLIEMHERQVGQLKKKRMEQLIELLKSMGRRRENESDGSLA